MTRSDTHVKKASWDNMVLGWPARERHKIKKQKYRERNPNLPRIHEIIRKCLMKRIRPKKIIKILIWLELVEPYDTMIGKKIYHIKYRYGIHLSQKMHKFREDLRQAVADGLTKEEIAAKFNLESIVHVERTIARFGLSLKTLNAEIARTQILEMYQAGKSKQEIVEATNRCIASVNRVLRNHRKSLK